VAPNASATKQRAIAHAAGAKQAVRLSPTALELTFAPGTLHAKAAQLRARDDVRYVEPNTAIHSSRIPNDPYYSEQWPLQNADPAIGAPAAWDRTTGSRSIVVGVLDSGVDLGHPDLRANLWSNPGGIGGCAAGTHGLNLVEGGCTPQDGFGHGTHVAGTIGAVGGNGGGVTGINWTTRLMALRVLDDDGSGDVASAVAGIQFAIQARRSGVDVRVLNASWGDEGGQPPPTALREAIEQAGAVGILFVTAAGNVATDLDASPEYPCSFGLANEICVAATTDNPADSLAFFSNYGDETVDLAAPGVGVLSTWPVVDGSYAFATGTSMAAPHVAGAAALMLASQCMSVGELKLTLLANVEPVPALDGLVATGGRLDIGRAVGVSQGRWCAWDTLMPALSGGVTSAPAITSWAPGRLDVFARSGSGRLAHTWSTGAFATWEDLGGGLLGAPAAVSWSAGRIDVFVRGTDNRLWHKWYAGRWSAWEQLGGSLSSAPAVASWFPGRLDVFARGSDGRLWHKWYSGGWSLWEPLGGTLGGDPGAVSWGLGRLDVAVRGTDGRVWHRWYAGGWSPWEPLGGVAVGATAISSRAFGALDIFVAGTNGHLWHKWFDGSWHGYEDLGGSLDSGPSAVSWASNRIDVVARSGSDVTGTYWEP
jgi:hypothetical protein